MIINKCDTALYLDTNALVKYYKNELGSNAISKIIASIEMPIYLSPLVIVEFIGVITKCIRSRQIKRKHLKPILHRLILDINNKNINNKFKMLQINSKTFSIANNVLLKNSIKHSIGSYDSIHLANYIQLQPNYKNIIFVTSDKALLSTCNDEKIAAYNPEKCKMCMLKLL